MTLQFNLVNAEQCWGQKSANLNENPHKLQKTNLVVVLLKTSFVTPLLKRVQLLTLMARIQKSDLGCGMPCAKPLFCLPRRILDQLLCVVHALKEVNTYLSAAVHPVPCFPPCLGWFAALPSPHAQS